jgi:hypothetical protein
VPGSILRDISRREAITRDGVVDIKLVDCHCRDCAMCEYVISGKSGVQF